MPNSRRDDVQRYLHTLFDAGTVAGLTDGELLERFAAGRGEAAEVAFAALVERHGAMVLRVSRKVLRDEHAAEDAFQATFLVLARNAHSIRRRDTLAPYLHGVAVRVAACSRAAGARRLRHERRSAVRARSSYAAPEVDDSGRVVHEELGRLPERFQGVAVLCDLEGKSYAEAARLLGCPIGTVMSRLAEARRRLRLRLARRGLAPAAGAIGARLVGQAEAAPTALAEATIRAATRVAGGRAVTAGVASSSVVALTEGVIKVMFLSRIKVLAACLLVMAGALIATGFTLLAAISPGGPPPEKAAGDVTAKVAPEKRGEPSPRIDGVVVDERGAPVAGARVAFLRSLPHSESATTDRDGAFRFASASPMLDYGMLRATADGGARQGLYRFKGRTANKTNPTPIRVVVKPTHAVNVSVRDGGGRGVPGAAVEIFDDRWPLAEATTDPRGIAGFRIPADAQVSWVVALKSGMGIDYFESFHSRTPTDPVNSLPATLDLVLGGARTVRVKVIGSDDRPVPGIEVGTSYFRKKGKIDDAHIGLGTITRVKTDAKGIATFDWIPDDLEGGFTFSTHSGGFRLREQIYYDPSRTETELTARVLRPTRVAGKVTLPDGTPAAGIVVQAEGSGETTLYYRGEDVSAEDGSYGLDVYPDQIYILAVVDENWAAPGHVGIVVREGEPREGLDFQLGKGTLIRGRLTTGPDHKPAANETVTVIQHEYGRVGVLGGAVPNLVRWTTTGVDGRYAIRVGPGKYSIFGRSESKHVEIKVAGEETIDHDIAVTTTPRTALAGLVEAGGKPLVGALVRGEPVNKPIHTGFEATTDAAGRFRVKRFNDPMILYARDVEGTVAALSLIAADEEDVTIIARPAAKAAGRVVDHAGKPRRKVRVQCSLLKGSVDAGDTVPLGVIPPQVFNAFATTDNEGRFSFAGLVVGEGVLLSAGDGSGNFKNSINQNFDVPGNDPFRVASVPIVLPDIILDPPAP